jgi:mannose-6-phosphate isomerase-like protein (cupin superfamily)
MMAGQHFHFDSLAFDAVVAHGGAGTIGFKRVVTNGAGGAYRFLDLSIVPPGATIGVHTHEPDNEEIYVVIAGQGRMRLDDREFDVSAGHVIINGAGGTHGLSNTGDCDLKLMVIEIPTR